MDGECVSSWLDQALSSSSSRVQRALAHDLQGPEGAALEAELGCVNSLAHVAETLEGESTE